jgi:DNA-binding NarL/FixJ family response regulator
VSVPRVLLADDHTLLLDAFRKLLSDSCEVVGTVTNGKDLLDAAERLRPDVAVVDVTMPMLNGVAAARRLKELHPEIRILFLTMNEDPDVAAEAFRAGASGYLLKRSASPELLTAIRELMKGRRYISPLVADGLVESMMHAEEHRSHEVTLTPRQREIVQLIAEGRSMKEAAAILNVTPRTVAFHKYRIMEVLDIKTTAELVQYAIRTHIV